MIQVVDLQFYDHNHLSYLWYVVHPSFVIA